MVFGQQVRGGADDRRQMRLPLPVRARGDGGSFADDGDAVLRGEGREFSREDAAVVDGCG
nr:hypothetical protein [Glycomyces buryatensis]